MYCRVSVIKRLKLSWEFDECKPLTYGGWAGPVGGDISWDGNTVVLKSYGQGLTLVHFSAQHKAYWSVSFRPARDGL